MSETYYPPLKPMEVGIKGKCPRCGRGKLFNGFLALAPHCDECGSDYSFADPADGPAFFVICFKCMPSVLFAVWLEVAFNVSLWVHLFVSLPVLLLSCILPLRPLKDWLVASQYYHKAEQGRLVGADGLTDPERARSQIDD